MILLTMAFLQRISEVNKVSIVITQGTKESLYKLIEQLVRGTAITTFKDRVNIDNLNLAIILAL